MSSMCTCTPYLHLTRNAAVNYVRRACDIPIWTEQTKIIQNKHISTSIQSKLRVKHSCFDVRLKGLRYRTRPGTNAGQVVTDIGLTAFLANKQSTIALETTIIWDKQDEILTSLGPALRYEWFGRVPSRISEPHWSGYCSMAREHGDWSSCLW